MVKTCLISNDDPNEFVKSLNACIADKKVIDIKYSSFIMTLESWPGGSPKTQTTVDRALVIYEVETKDEALEHASKLADALYLED